MHAEREAVALRVDRVEHLIESVSRIAHDVQYRPEDLACQSIERIDLDRERRDEIARCGLRPERHAMLPARAPHDCGCVRLQTRPRLRVDYRPDVGRQQTGISDHEFIHVAGQQALDLVGDLLLHEQHAQSRTALACAVERGHHDVSDDLLRQGGTVDQHGIESAGFRNECRDRAVARREAPMNEPGRFRRARERNTADTLVRHECAANFSAIAGQEREHRRRHAGSVQQLDGASRHQRRLFGRLRDDRVARHQAGRDLSRENRQGKIPGTDAGKGAAPVAGKMIALPRRPRQELGSRHAFGCQVGVVTQEVDGLTHLGDTVGQRLAGFAYSDCDEARHLRIEEVGRTAQYVCACRRPERIPVRLRRRSDFNRRARQRRVRAFDGAHDIAEIGWIDDRRCHATPALSIDDRARSLFALEYLGHGARERVQFVAVGEIDAARVDTTRAKQISRQRDARVRDFGKGQHLLDRILRDFCHG